MGEMVWLAAMAIVLLFCFVVAFGAPYVPTLNPRIEDALDLLDLKPGQVLLELGCGDGRVLRAAAKRGVHGVGYELNPLLVLYAKLTMWRYRSIVSVKWANYWHVQWPQADGVYVFLLDRYMKKLDTKIVQWQQRPVRLVSFAFTVPLRRPVRERQGLFVYQYELPPAAARKESYKGIEK